MARPRRAPAGSRATAFPPPAGPWATTFTPSAEPRARAFLSPAAFPPTATTPAARRPRCGCAGCGAHSRPRSHRSAPCALVALNTPLASHPPLALWALVLVGPLALLAANLLAAWPGQRAARLHSAQILRAE